MADEKSKILTGADGSGKEPALPEAGGSPVPKQEQKAPEAPAPEKAPKEPEQAAPAQGEKKPEIPKEPKAEVLKDKAAPNVSVYNFSEIMKGKKEAEKFAPEQDGKAPGKTAPASPTKETAPKQKEAKEPEQPKRKGRPPKEDKAKAAAPVKKDAPAKKEAQKAAPAKKTEKAAPAGKDTKAEKTPQTPKPAKSTPEAKTPPQPEAAPPAPSEAPRPQKEEQIVYLKLSDLHAFKNHPFQVRNDEEMRAMVSSVKDKGVTQPAIVRPREDGGYEIVSGHRRQKASELAGFTDMPCIVRNLTDEQAITQMVEDNTNQRENILPSERAKALKMQLEAIKHQGARETSGQIDPKDARKRSNEIVAERNKMTVKQVQRYIKLNDLVPDLTKLMDEGRIKFTPAVELSYIKPKNQNYIAVAIDSQQSSPSLSQAQRMRELDQKGILNGDVIDGIMMEDKKEVDKVVLTGAELSKYFGKEATPREMKDQIIKLLDDWKGQQKEVAKPEKKTNQQEK